MENTNIFLVILLIVTLLSLFYQLIGKKLIKDSGKITDEQQSIIENAISEAVDTANKLYKAGSTEERKEVAIQKAYEIINNAGIKVEKVVLEQIVQTAVNIKLSK